MIRHVWSVLFGALLAAAGGLAEPTTRWTMLDVTPAEGQADCHLLEFADGTRVLIDAADGWDAPGAALAQLRQRNIKRLDLVVISHFHQDHYGRLLDILNDGITVGRVVVNVPDRRCADSEIPWGCNWNDVQALLGELRTRNVPVVTPAAGDRIWEVKTAGGVTTGIDVLCLYDGMKTPIGQTDVNDTSIILRVFHGPTRIIFAGDLNHALGEYLALGGLDLKADLLKVPHHGTEGTAPDVFFDRVNASAVLVPSPTRLWASGRSLRIRNYFLSRKIPAYVSGLRGNVTVTLTARGYVIETER